MQSEVNQKEKDKYQILRHIYGIQKNGTSGYFELSSTTQVLGFAGGSVEKNPHAMQEEQERQAQSQGQEDPLKDGMAAHSSILAWRIPWTEEPGCSPQGRKESDRLKGLSMHAHGY